MISLLATLPSSGELAELFSVALRDVSEAGVKEDSAAYCPGSSTARESRSVRSPNASGLRLTNNRDDSYYHRLPIYQLAYRIAFIFVLMLAWPCFAAEPLTVTAILSTHQLELSNGKRVRLLGIKGPEPAYRKTQTADPLADDAMQWLERQIKDKPVTLGYDHTKEDRYGRLLAFVYPKNSSTSIQQALLRAGWAIVYSFPDNTAQLTKLLKAEAVARNAGLGIWQHPAYRLLSADDISGLRNALQHYRVVQGTVRQVVPHDGHIYLDFGENWREDFTAFLNKHAARQFTAERGLAWNDLPSLVGKQVRVRGWLFPKHGPMMEVTHPEQMELLH